MRKMVAPVSRQMRSSSSPISRRVCCIEGTKGLIEQKQARARVTSVRAMHRRWRMPPESCAG